MTCEKNDLYEFSRTVHVVPTCHILGSEWEHNEVVEAYRFGHCVLKVEKSTEMLELAEVWNYTGWL
jgi:hypothetical protein